MLLNRHSGKSVWVGAAAVAAAVVLLIVIFVVQSVPQEQDSIVLPTESLTSEENESSEQGSAENTDPFITITTENVQTVMETLVRPAAYHLSYTVSVGKGAVCSNKNVELWVNSGLLHAEVSDDRQTRTLVSDGITAYLWYSESTRYVSVKLDSGTTVEDLLGLPDFDSYLTIPAGSIKEAEYLFLKDLQLQCIYVCAKEDWDQTTRYWVNLDNGILCKIDALENGEQVYSVIQNSFDLLAVEDEIFSDRFILPDGTNPFTAAAKKQQP